MESDWLVKLIIAILKGHKFTYGKRGLQHRHCDAPNNYLSRAEYIKTYGHPPY